MAWSSTLVLFRDRELDLVTKLVTVFDLSVGLELRELLCSPVMSSTLA